VPVRVVLAEDSFLAMEALRHLLGEAPEVDLVAECHDADELRAAVDAVSPDVVVTDIHMPPTMTDDGIQVAVELERRHPGIGVVVLSAYCEPGYALTLFGSGSERRAYLLKERVHTNRQLIATIEAVARGGSVIDPQVVRALMEHDPRPLSGLSPREHEILACMAGGAGNAAIAEHVGLSKRSVEKHIGSIFTKLGLPATPDVSRRVHAVLLFLAERGALAHPGRPRSARS
jgi:DNA-binding NarL/FixJ family response regulator